MAEHSEADVSVSREVGASPDVVWEMVTDLPRMGEWSPECQGGHWRDGITRPAVGARFAGANRNGLFRWKTTSTVSEMEPRTRFAFDVGFMGIPAASWRYDIEATDSGCTVTESWTDRRARWFALLGLVGTGVGDRKAHNRQTMEATLEALADAAESSGSTSAAG